jgi:hypothetical protein
MKINNDILELIIVEKDDGEENVNEMATVGDDQNSNISVRVNPDVGRNDAYIKVYDDVSFTASSKVIRLAFKELKAFDHRDGKEFWEIYQNKYKTQLKALVKFLKAKPKSKKWGSFDTNWDLAIFLWNNECGFLSHKDYDENCPEGCKPGSVLANNPQFVPFNTKMPPYLQMDANKVRRRKR